MFGLLKIILDVSKKHHIGKKIRNKMDIGRGTCVGLGNVDGMFPLLAHIGENCIFAPKSMILTHDASYYLHTGEYRVAPVYIGDNVFIGYGAIIMPGTTIGSNVVVGAGSIVTHDVPSGVVVVGIPAKVVCSISEYIEKRKEMQMFEPPYKGKTPDHIEHKDIMQFTKSVYATCGIVETEKC